MLKHKLNLIREIFTMVSKVDKVKADYYYNDMFDILYDFDIDELNDYIFKLQDEVKKNDKILISK